jgi:L-amino acid N-acyltransferase YncA
VLRKTEQVRVRPAVRADLGAVAGILAFYVTNSVATFEDDPPGLPHWQQRLDALAGRGLPFMVAEAAGVVAGYAYASPWRPKPAYRHTVEDSVYLAPGPGSDVVADQPASVRTGRTWQDLT